MRRGALFLCGLAAAALASLAAAQPATPAYQDPELPAEQRAADLVSRMTLEEKARQVGHDVPAIPRLGVPEYVWVNEGLHGVARAGIATVFPQAIGMSATWDAPLMQQVADVISTEFRAKYVERVKPNGGTGWFRGLTVWSPNINIFRDPRWGRGQETYGEDPYLTSRMAVSFIRGLQGSDPNYFKTIATSKHYAVHSGPELNRHRENVYPTPYDLEDTYLPAFRASVTEGGVQSLMCVYNAVDGIPGCASEMLLQDHLREAWKFPGYVVSDCGAIANIYREDALHYEPDPVKTVALVFNAGLDLICGDYRNNWTMEFDPIVKAVNSGLLPQDVLDRALVRLFTARYRLGLLDPPERRPFQEISEKDYDTPAHQGWALKMAQESMVLLKNDGNLLPLKGEPRTIAVIGPNAHSLDTLIGNYNGQPSQPITVLDGIRTRFPNSRILYAEGTGLVGPAEPPVPDSMLCVDRGCRQRGLQAQHFAGRQLQGTPTATGVEPNARLEWLGDRATSARWTGFITAPESGVYRFRHLSENGYRVWVDDRLVVDEWGVGDSPSMLSGAIRLQKGRRYPLKVEAFQVGGRGEQRLLWSRPSENGNEAVALARQADLVVFVGGLSARIEGEEMKLKAPGFSGGDRTSLDLPGPQQQLLERVHATGKPVVLVLMNGSAMSVNWADQNVPAIIEAWYPGGSGGYAVAQLLAGDYSPAGRLPVTFYKSADQLAPFSDYSMKNRTYRYFKGEVLYPFGHGLSFTSFAYANPRVSAATVPADGTVTVSVDLTNTGDRDSDEVVQLYVSHPDVAIAPMRSLQGFRRIHLKKGESRTVDFVLGDRMLSLVDSKGVRSIRPGKVDVWVGGGQPLTRAGLPQVAGAATSFTVTGSKVLPK